ncbi:hypothetical protein [Falsirhodobacter sp. 1013]|uniref:hypothetical protein n=1 Tax=Falsirhodobacter sp. 1013 TaxID=3417566 RepID=UPI003EB85A0B
MTKIYGGCIDAEGRDLEDDVMEHVCRACGQRGRTRFWEKAEGGSLNSYQHTYCLDCTYQDGDDVQGPDVRDAMRREEQDEMPEPSRLTRLYWDIRGRIADLLSTCR